MRLRCTTEAWLYRLAIRENSAASVTHCFGPHDTCRATTAALSVPVFDAGNISPHLAPLFRRAGLRSARQSASTLETVRRRLRDAATRQEGCAMKPWLNVGEGAEYAGLSRDTIYTACERKELRHVRVSGRRSIRLKPEWIDAWLERHARGAQEQQHAGHGGSMLGGA